MTAKPIPDGYHSITPYIVATSAAKLISFLKVAFGATEHFPPMTTPDGTIRHAELRIGDSIVMLAEADPKMAPARPCTLYHYVTDVDAVFDRAVNAGAEILRPPSDQFYGDRTAGVVDPSGNQWWIATNKEEVSPEELARRMAEQMKSAAHA